MIAGDADAIRRRTVIDTPARGFGGDRIEIEHNMEIRSARQQFRAVRGIRHEHHLIRTIGDMIASMARGMAIGRDRADARNHLSVRPDPAQARGIGGKAPRTIGEGGALAFGTARFIAGIAPPGNLRLRHDHLCIGEGGSTFGIQQAIYMIAMKMAHHHAGYPCRVNAGSLHIGNHPAIGRPWGRDAIAAVENYQITPGIEEGDGEGYHQPVLRQEGIAQYCLNIRQGRVAHKPFQGTCKKPVMYGGDSEGTDLETVETWRLGLGRGRCLGRCSGYKRRACQQRGTTEQQMTSLDPHGTCPSVGNDLFGSVARYSHIRINLLKIVSREKDPRVHPPPAEAQDGFFRSLMNRLLGRGTSLGGRQGMFLIRNEVARLQAAVANLNTSHGRRDIASVKALLANTYRRDFEAAVRDRVHTVPLPDGTVLCRVLGRYKMYVDATDVTLAPHLMMDGLWQYWITAFLCRNLDRGEVCYDLEAGYGYYALLMSELVGPDGSVVALEYNPWLFQLLKRNLAINGRDGIVVTHRICVASKASAARELPAQLTGTVAGMPASTHFRRVQNTSCIAPTMTLDGLEPGSADLVLVSEMALEQGALQGMKGLMDRSPSLRIIVNFSVERCPDPHATLEDLAARFPLRFIDVDARARPITIQEVEERGRLSLFLSRSEPR